MEDNCKSELQERQTLIQAFERLDQKCFELEEVARLTERLNEKLNRTEGSIKVCADLQKEDSPQINIIQMFNSLADKIEVQINVIGKNTEISMGMID